MCPFSKHVLLFKKEIQHLFRLQLRVKTSSAFLLLLQMHIICKQKNIFKDSSTFLQFQSQCWTVSLCMILTFYAGKCKNKLFFFSFFFFSVFVQVLHVSLLIFVYLKILNTPTSSQILRDFEYSPSVFVGHTLFNSSLPLFNEWKITQECVKCYTWVQMHVSDSLLGISKII